ncbi:unnamed protein product, partial [Didymodactylos carnosus]
AGTEVDLEKSILNRIHNQQHLLDTIKKIRLKTVELNVRTMDVTEISTILVFVNDMIRISNLLNVNNDILKEKPLPRLEVPASVLGDDNSNVYTGDLIIVDTPGPNERGLSDQLKIMVANELQRSALIVIVLDYTSLNNENQEQLTHDISVIRHVKGHRENDDDLYALVNKIDQRTKKDLTKEQTMTYVTSQFGIRSNNVYEMSGKSALICRIFLSEYQTLRMNNKERFKYYVILRHYQFAVYRTMKLVARTCLLDASEHCAHATNILQQHVTLRLMGLKVNREKLLEALKHLSNELYELQNCRVKLKVNLNDWKAQLINEISSIFKNDTQACYQLVIDLFNSEAQLLDYALIYQTHITSMLKNHSFVDDKLKFKSKEEADKFTKTVIDAVRHISEVQMLKTSLEVNKHLEEARVNLETEIRNFTEDIQKRISERLSNTFSMKIKCPELNKKTSNYTSLLELVRERKDTVYYRPWYLLWIVKRTIEISTMEVSVPVMRQSAADMLKENFDRILQKAHSSINEELEQQFIQRFNYLGTFIRKYALDVQKSLNDKFRVEHNKGFEKQLTEASNELAAYLPLMRHCTNNVRKYFETPLLAVDEFELLEF